MKVADIAKILFELSPLSLQEEWDNSGLNIGSFECEVGKIYASLEASLEVVQSLDPNSLLITHHPLFFRPIKSLCYDEYPSNIARELIKKDCSLISLHTNFDHSHLNRFFASEVLGFGDLVENGIALESRVENMSFESLLEMVEKKCSVDKVVKSCDRVDLVSVVCGAGASALGSLKSGSVLITGDIKYHDGMIAKSRGVGLIDVGHFESEKYFASIVFDILKIYGYEVIIRNSKNPFCKE